MPAVGRNARAFTVGGLGYILEGPDKIPEVWCYNPNANSWVQKNNFPGAAYGATIFVINDTAYAGNGQDTLGNYHTDFWKYNAGTDQWIRIADFPGAGRYTAMSFALNGKGYVGCGKAVGPFKDFYAYDPVANTWAQKADFAGAPRQSGIGVSAGGKGYMGLGYNGSALDDIYQYDPVRDIWTTPVALAAGARFWTGCAVLKDTIYIVGGGYLPNGGGNATSFLSDCWMYDTTSNTWIAQPDLACVGGSRELFGSFVINNHAYFPCGDGPTGKRNDMLEFGPADNTFIESAHVLGNDTMFSGVFSRILSTGDSCTVWSTGVTGPQITVTTFGTYWAHWNDSCGMWGDTIRLIDKAGVGINQINADEALSIFPNPTNNNITIQTGLTESYQISIYNVAGELMRRETINGPSAQFDLSSYSTGLYFIELKGSSFSVNRKIIKLQ